MLSGTRKTREGARVPTTPWYAFAVGAGVVLILRLFVVELVQVESASMAPTLASGDTVVVFRAAYGPVVPFIDYPLLPPFGMKHGHVILFRRPDTGEIAIKRVIGVADDEIRVFGDRVHVAGTTLYSSYRLDSVPTGTIPAGFVFVAGDNRDNSVDSRHYGLVPEMNILGRVLGF